MLQPNFFNRETELVARQLLGKVLRMKYKNIYLSARIIETEAYYLKDKSSHASLGFTEKRKALFMPAGTIYMYYARGDDSMNVSCKGKGNAVLIKSGIPFIDERTPKNMINTMQKLNPIKNTKRKRAPNKLCGGQTLICKSLNITVPNWDQQQFQQGKFFIEDVQYAPEKIIQTTRLGIPTHRDPHHMYRFIDYDAARDCTSNPLGKRGWECGKDYFVLTPSP